MHVNTFHETTPTLTNYWRSIILFGKNVASYKFALAQALLDLSSASNDLIRIEELAIPFSTYICNHLNSSDKQATSPTSSFLDACRNFNSNVISREELIERTVRSGFNHVLDAFHIVNQAEISVKFFVNERRENKAIRLTESLYELAESAKIKNLHHETEARWRLVEVAWELGLARHFAPINYDADSNNLVILKDSRRKNITSSRDALNGYQKGVCFYCFSPISTIPGEDNLADVDHFFPHTLKKFRVIQNLDGIWNLVLACGNCNKGVDGKLARLPSLNLLERLARRNEYLIASHHPLRETLMLQTAKTPSARGQLLQKCFSVAEQILIHKWEPIAKGARAF